MNAADLFALLLNITSSVFIISVNKSLMGSAGYKFQYVVTLNALHYLATTVWTYAAKYFGLTKAPAKDEKASVPLNDIIFFTVFANMSIISLNTSLMINSITMYQIAKLGIIPCTAVVEKMLYGRVFTLPMIGAIVVTLAGVALVAVAEFELSPSAWGTFVALLSILSSSSQQLLVRHLQLKHGVSSGALLGVLAPAQGFSLLLLSPFLDKLTTGTYVTEYEWTGGAAAALGLSCSAAVLVNLSQFLVLGRFTAVTYQVLGHAKTVAVLVVGWACFGGTITAQQLAGMGLAVGGMVTYSQASATAPADVKHNTGKRIVDEGGKNSDGDEDDEKEQFVPHRAKKESHTISV
ncbi:triose-phosphate transporter family-domain-containing protein [Pelagophyceae sp. CCMP2097]|nr:triose-phosphate transporter family-domain-containing protein [Pelagophyceae sp. CCMP2097]